jgi:TonB family protein
VNLLPRNAAVGVARLWTRLYTAGLPEEERHARREEIESDLWETAHDAGADGSLGPSLQVLGRLVTGVVDDLGWRWEQEAIMRRTWKFGVAAGVVAGLVFTWIAIGSQAPVGPAVNPPPRMLHATMAPPPPPPPAPPPTIGAPAAPVTFTYAQASYVPLDNAPVPVRLTDVRPVHPPIARWAGVGGTVVIDATIGANGRITDARIRESVPMLDQSALDAVRQWVFQPRTELGAPLAVPIRVTVAYPQSH